MNTQHALAVVSNDGDPKVLLCGILENKEAALRAAQNLAKASTDPGREPEGVKQTPQKKYSVIILDSKTLIAVIPVEDLTIGNPDIFRETDTAEATGRLVDTLFPVQEA